MHSAALSRLALTLCLLATPAVAAGPTHWVGTWAAAPSPVPNRDGAITATTTLREIVHVSRGGSTLRVTFSNELGTDPLTLAGAHLGQHGQGSQVTAGSDLPLTFGGQPSISIPPGAVAVSDPVSFRLAPLSDLVISLLLPAQPLHMLTQHDLGLQTNFEAPGDQLASPELHNQKPFGNWRFLKNVEVSGDDPGGAIVAFGDSITDGLRSAPDANRRWPDVLAQRLQTDKRLRGLSVLNEGISGNRLLHDKAGPSALARFDRDVLSQSGVRYLIVLEGINDIGRTVQPQEAGDPVTTQQLLVSYGQLIARAHAHGIKVYGATLTPFLGAGYASPAGEAMRQAVNTWIRTSGQFDAVIDFDQLTRDPNQPSLFSPAADSGDHLHPGENGYKGMGDGIDLKLFAQ